MKGYLIVGLLVGWAFSAQAEEPKPMITMAEFSVTCRPGPEWARDPNEEMGCLMYMAGVLDTFGRVCLPSGDDPFYVAAGRIIGSAVALSDNADPDASAALAVILAAAPWQCEDGVASVD